MDISYPLDISLYLVTDRSLSGERSLSEIVSLAVSGGVTIVQLREKEIPLEDLVAIARNLIKVLRPRGIPLIINDNAEAAVLSEADGLHVGQHDLPVEEARALIGPRKILGLSIDDAGLPLSPSIAAAAVDYLAIGPIFTTSTKLDAGKAVGHAAVARLRSKTNIPIVGIGGITASNAGSVISAGAAGVAVVSAIFKAADPQREAEKLRNEIEHARGEVIRSAHG